MTKGVTSEVIGQLFALLGHSPRQRSGADQAYSLRIRRHAGCGSPGSCQADRGAEWARSPRAFISEASKGSQAHRFVIGGFDEFWGQVAILV